MYHRPVRLLPTLRASHLTWAGLALVIVGLVRVAPHAVASGCTLIFGVAISRAITSISVARARSAGFEMLWLTRHPRAEAIRNSKTVIRAELRNRDTLTTHFKDLSLTHSPGLQITASPNEGSIAPGGKLAIELHVVALRVGYHGIFGLSLNTIRAPGLFTVPLAFSNPFVLDVSAPVAHANVGAGFLARNATNRVQTSLGAKRGEALELKELREHQAGDAYRRIAWKASARRGKLMVIDRELESQETAWLILDISTDSASGEIGSSAMDRTVDTATNLIAQHQRRGDVVGVAMFGARALRIVSPDRSARHYLTLRHALCHSAHTADQDRSAWDSEDVALKFLEHARSIDRQCHALSPRDRDLLVHHAKRLVRRAPVRATEAWSTQESDQILRNYLLSFGIQPPPRAANDRFQTQLQMARFIRDLYEKRSRCSLISIIGRPPGLDTPRQLLEAYRVARRQRIEVHYHPVLDVVRPKPETESDARSARELQAMVVTDAILHRQRLEAEDGVLQLIKLGVRVPSPQRTPLG